MPLRPPTPWPRPVAGARRRRRRSPHRGHGNNAQIHFQTRELDIRLCAQKVNALQMILTEKKEEWANGAVGYTKKMCEGLGISFTHHKISEAHNKEAYF